MIPNTADGMPQISDGGRTYTIKVKPGIYFAADPAFKGRKRELVAEDYVYSIKRVFDPKVRSYWLYLFENNLVGLDDVLAQARKTGSLDYDAPIEGVRTLDKYTLRIKFKNPDYVFQWWLTYDGLAAVAREVVDAYKDESNRVADHPVGTGAYRLASGPADKRSCSRRIRIFAAKHFRYRVRAAHRVTLRSRVKTPARSCRSSAASTSASSRKRNRGC
jgi:ABC-type transport system substrate-binding protein